MIPGRPSRCSVLLMEDDADHGALVLRALADASPEADVSWVRDGQTALDYLRHDGPYRDPAAARRPDLILLDVHVPKVEGFDVLSAIKADAGLKTIPVVMLTTSGAETDVRTSYALGANSFIPKPVRYADFAATIRNLTRYWMVTNVSPER